METIRTLSDDDITGIEKECKKYSGDYLRNLLKKLNLTHKAASEKLVDETGKPLVSQSSISKYVMGDKWISKNAANYFAKYLQKDAEEKGIEIDKDALLCQCDNTMNLIGARIRCFCNANNITLDELAEKIRETPEDLKKYTELGDPFKPNQYIPISVLYKIAEVLGIAPEEIVNYNEENPTEDIDIKAINVVFSDYMKSALQSFGKQMGLDFTSEEVQASSHFKFLNAYWDFNLCSILCDFFSNKSLFSERINKSALNLTGSLFDRMIDVGVKPTVTKEQIEETLASKISSMPKTLGDAF